jgi:hypothetical protein
MKLPFFKRKPNSPPPAASAPQDPPLDQALAALPRLQNLGTMGLVVPPVLYSLEIHTELETFPTHPMSQDEAVAYARHIAQYGMLLSLDESPANYVPAHRIYGIQFVRHEQKP